MKNMTLIDQRWGVSLQASGDSELSLTSLFDSVIYGETEAEDCPEHHDCWCKDKYGYMMFGSNHNFKKYMIDAASPLPMHKVKSYGTWAADTYIRNVEFREFRSNLTKCGGPQ